MARTAAAGPVQVTVVEQRRHGPVVLEEQLVGLDSLEGRCGAWLDAYDVHDRQDRWLEIGGK